MSKFSSIPNEIEAVQFNGDFNVFRQDMINVWPGLGTDRRLRRTVEDSQIVIQVYDDSNKEWMKIVETEWVVRVDDVLYIEYDAIIRERYQPMDEEADDALEVSVSNITEETDSEFGDTLGEIDLMEKLTELLKNTGKEKESGTADFILAQFVLGSLQVFEETIKMRAGYRHERWELDTDQNTNEGE